MLDKVVGDDSRLSFLLLGSLRSHLMRQPVLTTLTTLVVALAVALVIALVLSSGSVDRALSRSAEALKGKVDLEVTAGGVGLPERLLDDVSAVPAIATAAPVVETVVRIIGGPRDGQPLRIIGVDLLADQAMRNYSMVQKDLRVLDPLRLVGSSDSVIISKVLADPMALSDGDTLRVRSSDGEHALVVRGLLSSGGMGDAYAGQIAVMDVYALQALLKQQGWFDRIDLVLKPGISIEQASGEVAARIAGQATVQRPEQSDQFLGAAISTIQLMGTSIALAGALVAAILCYASIAASVDRRARLFGLLRAAGLEATRIHRLVYADTMVVAFVGTAAGIPLGWSLSGVFQGAFAEALSFVSGTEVESARMSLSVFLLGCALGVGVSILAAALATRRSTRLAAHEAITGGRGLSAKSRLEMPAYKTAGAIALLLVGCLGASVLYLPLPAIYRVGVTFVFGIALVWLCTAPVLSLLLSSVRVGFERWLPGVGRVAAGSLQIRPSRTRIAILSISALVATATSLWIVTTSVFASIDRANSMNGGALIATMSSLGGWSKNLIAEDTAHKISNSPGVVAVFKQFASSTIFRGQTVRLSAITPEVLADRVGLDLIERTGANDADMARLLRSGGVFVYDSFQRRFGLGAGDLVRLDTPQGLKEFPIVGVRRTYTSSPTGGIQMDLETFDQHWPRGGFSNLVIWTSGDQRKVLESIQREVEQPLFVLASDTLDRMMRSTLEAEKTLIAGLLAVILALAGAAVASLMLTSEFERRADLSLLRCVGASRIQLVGVVMLQSVGIGTVGAIAGLLLGVVLALPLSGIVTEMLGWVISWSADPGLLVVLFAGTICLSALIGLLSALSVGSEPSWNSLASE